MSRFSGRTALVTGGAGGIGRAIAELIMADGGRVAIADLNLARAEETARDLGSGSTALEVDVTSSASLASMIQEAASRLGPIDVLFNNAGILNFGSFLRYREEAFDRIMAVNVKGSFLTAQAVAKHMISQGTPGVIVNTASVLGYLGVEGALGYGASKAAVIQMTKVMALELAPYNIRVNAVAPGIVDTAMMAKSIANAEIMAGLRRFWSIKRVARPEEVAAPALFLASAESSYMTGETIIIDGGWQIG